MNAVTAIQIVRQLIIDYMELGEQRVWISGERQPIPKDQAIFITLAPGPATVMSQNQQFDDEAETQTSTTRFAMEVAVEAASRGTEAIERHPEILQALSSDVAQRAMETHQLAIYRGGRTLDLTEIEGAGTLRRFRIQVIIHYMQTKTVNVAVFDKFRAAARITEEA